MSYYDNPTETTAEDAFLDYRETFERFLLEQLRGDQLLSDRLRAAFENGTSVEFMAAQVALNANAGLQAHRNAMLALSKS